jgi:hypothetical protein
MLQSGCDSEVVMLNARRLVVGFAAIVVTAMLMFAASSFQGQAVAPPLAAAEAGKAGSDAVQASTDGATRLVAVMTHSSLDLRQLNPKPGEQVIVDVFVTMGRARVRVPDHWVVNTGALPVMGSIAIEDDRFRAAGTGAPPRLVLRGFILIGKVEVTS